MELFTISWPVTPFQCNGVCRDAHQIMMFGTPIQDIKRSGDSGCPKCMLIYKCMEQYCEENLQVIIKIGLPGLINAAYISDSGTVRPLAEARLFYQCGTPKPAWDFIKPGKPFLDSRREGYRSLLTGWIKHCNSTHKICTDPNSTLPKRVLDVGTETEKRLLLYISSGEVTSYVALSHCWGTNGVVLRTTTSTIKNHQQAISFEHLPRNFQDAVTVTRGIGIRYLWVDSLCIIQDDVADWEIESSKMSSIYRDAYLVLAATRAAESSQGFLDLREVSDHFREDYFSYQLSVRHPPAQTGQIRNPDSTISKIHFQRFDYFGDSTRRHDMAINYSPLNRRAWVLQENILPKRIVHFTCCEILWECVESLKCECMEVDETPVEEKSPDLIRRAHFFNIYRSGISNGLHQAWLNLLEEYCKLAISHESDRLPALSGLANLWQSRGAGVYLAGLWQDNILNSMMWETRRPEPKKRWEAYRAPSWSPLALGYNESHQKQVSAFFEFHTDYRRISKEYAKVIDAQCTPHGKDPLGAVKSGHIILRTLVTKGYLEDPISKTPIVHDFDLDCGLEDQEGRELTFILLGYYEYDDDSVVPYQLAPRALIAVRSKTVSGAYERIGILTPPASNESSILDQYFQYAEEQEIKIV